MKSQLMVQSNLMLDDDRHKPDSRWIPGDLLGELYPEYRNPESIHLWMTRQQEHEYRRYLPCIKCGRPYGCSCQRI